MAVMHDSGALLPRDKAVERAATPEEQRETLALVRRGLEEGALGLGMGIAYVPLVSRAEILDLFRLAAEKKTAVYVHMRNGGPVEPGRGFVLHSTDWGGQGTLEIDGLCALSASIDILRAIAEGQGPRHWLIALGYAGWGPGQLDNEMRHHGWYAAGAHSEILFETPFDERWTGTWKAEGIDPSLLANVTGHA